MKLYIAPIIPLIIIGAILGSIFVVSKGPVVTTNAIYAAESGYAVALTAADTYRHLCVGNPATGAQAILPPSCKTTLATIQAEVKITDAAYQKVKGYEASPPAGAAADFLAAVSILQAAIPII